MIFMDKQQLIKNRLDLEYHGEAQKTNAYLILLTTGILGFLGTFIWLKENKVFGFVVTILILVIGGFLYKRSNDRMKEILEEIEKIQ